MCRRMLQNTSYFFRKGCWTAILFITLFQQCHSLFQTLMLRRQQLTVMSDSLQIDSSSQIPLKAMIFMDGSWLFHSLLIGRSGALSNRVDAMEAIFGANWRKTTQVNYRKISTLIANQLQNQLVKTGSPYRMIDVVRTHAFTSARANVTVSGKDRSEFRRKFMIRDMYSANFHVHNFISMRQELDAQEKCVDIALAVEMLSLAHVPGAYDIAVIVSGDKDFMPVLEKVRQLGKRTAIASMRNSCNKDLCSIDANIRDFEMIWLDENLEAFMELKPVELIPAIHKDHKLRRAVVRTIARVVHESGPDGTRSRILGRKLGGVDVDGFPSLTVGAYIKQHTKSLLNFMGNYPAIFDVGKEEATPQFDMEGFQIYLQPTFDLANMNDNDDDEDEDEQDTGHDFGNHDEDDDEDDEEEEESGRVIDYNNEKTQNRERNTIIPRLVAAKIVSRPLKPEDFADVREEFKEDGDMLIAMHRMDDEHAVLQVIVKTIAQLINAYGGSMSRFFLSGLLSRIKVGLDGEDMMSVISKTGLQIPIFIKETYGHIFELKTDNEIVLRRPKDYLPSPLIVKLADRTQAAAAAKKSRLGNVKPFSVNTNRNTLDREQVMQIQQQRHQQMMIGSISPSQGKQQEQKTVPALPSSNNNQVTENLLKAKKISELKEYLKNQNLPQYGTKEQLVQRLLTDGKIDESMLSDREYMLHTQE